MQDTRDSYSKLLCRTLKIHTANYCAGHSRFKQQITVKNTRDSYSKLLWQDTRDSYSKFRQYHKIERDLLAHLRKKGEDLDPQSIGGCLLRIVDPKTGKPLPDRALLPEIGIFFFAGDMTRQSFFPIFWQVFMPETFKGYRFARVLL